MAGGVFGFQVPRVCRVRGGSGPERDLFTADDGAFRVDGQGLVTEVSQLDEGALASPSVVAASGAMVVLGEPGAGKTSVLTGLVEGLPRLEEAWEGGEDACVWVSGGDLTEASYADELGCHFEVLPAAGSTGDGAGILTVVLDQADESSYLRHLSKRLKRSLRGRDIGRVRFLMACRTADYPPDATGVLAEVFGTCRCVDLAPLSRQEAVALVDSAGAPGEEVVTAAEVAGAAALACVPLTLELLVMTYRVDGRLHGTPRELFARGVQYLAEDPDPDRLSHAVTTTAPQRLVVAGRIAAWMLLSGHRSVWRGHSLSAGTFDLPGERLASGQEQAAAGTFNVTSQVVQETLTTALFTAPDVNRVSFRHSSVAAYLAARYLTERQATQRQLENLFLVGAPDGGTASIPIPLRETAAWLVAMNPTATRWLVGADPESLAVHSTLVRFDEIRQLTVERLLDRAAQIELSGHSWQPTRWDLHHPQLADQLTDVLRAAPEGEAADWPTRARIRLAIRLAQEAGTTHPGLAAALLHLVENDTWHQTERRLAARAAFTCDPGRAIPVLKEVLASLIDPAHVDAVDPDDALRGTLLSLLWPDHLDAATMLAALRPPRSQHTYGMYAHFLRAMPDRCTDEQLPEVLTWAEKAATASTRPRPAPTAQDNLVETTVLAKGAAEDQPGDGFDFAPHRVEAELLDALVNRTLSSQNATQHLDTLARIIFSRFQNHHTVRLPDALQPDEHGHEPPHVQKLRRALADALIGEAVRSKTEPRLAAWLIVREWERRSPLLWGSAPEHPSRHLLLDGADFPWAWEQIQHAAASGNEEIMHAYGELASTLFPHGDQDAFELAYDDQHPGWPYMRHLYEAVDLGSDLAKAWRRNHQGQDSTWPESTAFLAEQKQLLADARDGDNDSLWKFLWHLRVDPQTGRFEELPDTIRAWPGSAALQDNLTDLTDLALRYLTTEDDHADSWLGQNLHNKRSWAGYALLTELHHANRITDLPPNAWKAWAAALLTENLHLATSYTEDTRQDLLRMVAIHAPEELARRVDQLARAELADGSQPLQLNPLDPRWAPQLRSTLEQLAAGLSARLGVLQTTSTGSVGPAASDHSPVQVPDTSEARDAAIRTWHSLLTSLLEAGSQVAYDIAETALVAPAEAPESADLLLPAAQALLATDAATHWPRIQALTAAHPGLSHRLAEACAQDHISAPIQTSLAEAALADLYHWLSDLYAPEEDMNPLGAHWVTPQEQARRWRDSLLGELSRRATAEAVIELGKLANEYPDRLSIAAALVTARTQHSAASWDQVRLEDVIKVLHDPARRVLRSSTDLLAAAGEVLEQIAQDIPSHGELLWDRTPGQRTRKKTATAEDAPVPDTWRPKPEAALCAYLAHELRLRLGGHHVAVNREVLIHPTDAYGAGDRTDILIDAMPSPGDSPHSASEEPVRLVIEVKGSWNPSVTTAQEDQLAGRYLPETKTDAGIYLVGWYPIDLWDAVGDKRKTQAKKLDLSTLRTHLAEQARKVSEAATVHLRPIVVEIPRPYSR
ncbi:hypothetical protein [Streptomyces sp. NPDC047841]|uniref:hypothetical protein n=1 Tax=Streptomyces sp. NPDC047841 TaxID=3154708 RepID=UPI0034529134